MSPESVMVSQSFFAFIQLWLFEEYWLVIKQTLSLFNDSQDYMQFIALGKVYHRGDMPFSWYHIGESSINIADDVEIDYFVKVVFVRFLHEKLIIFPSLTLFVTNVSLHLKKKNVFWIKDRAHLGSLLCIPKL